MEERARVVNVPPAPFADDQQRMMTSVSRPNRNPCSLAHLGGHHMTSSARTLALAATVFQILMATSPKAQADRTAACASLANQQLPDTTITAAQAITTGSFTPPGSTNATTNLPPFCRVTGAIRPARESNILFEVWLPLDKWNGKFAGVGNGGWAGSISFGALQDQLR